MKWIIIPVLSVLVLLLTKSFKTVAQAAASEASIRECLGNYMSGDGNRMEKAFHSSATMKYIDYRTGQFRDVPIAEFIARVKRDTTKAERKAGIEAINMEGNAAQAKIKIEMDGVIFYDYMNLLQINGEWKIVSKIFSSKNK